MDTRDRPIRGKIISLVVAPIAALLALWIFATTLAVGPALNLLNVQTLLDTIGKPGEYLVAELQHERKLTAEYLAGSGDGAALGAQRARTDQVIAKFRTAAGSDAAREAAVHELDTKIAALFAAVDGIPAARGRIDRRQVGVNGALTFYNDVIDVSFRMFFGSATFNDPEVDRGIRAITTLGRGREWLSQADAQLAAAFTARKLTDADHARLIGVISTQRFLYAEAAADLSFEDRAAYERAVGEDAFVRLIGFEDSIVASTARSGGVPVDAAAWRSAYAAAVPKLREVELAAADRLDDTAGPIAAGILIRLGLAGLVGLGAVVVSVLVAVRVGRSLISRLTGLRASALDLAEHRLPDVVRRLAGGQPVDVDAEAPPLEYGKDEIGQVGHAFSEVQRTAVRSAVQEAQVRRGINEVFLNIARRSQALLHRQLALLDKMERRAGDPQELEDLYRVDHLATRMRRHAEDLVILAGATPGRGWRNPVPVIDVIRGAISEVEDYRRIDVTAVEHAAVVGRAVGDVIHLLAELLENAASFSPPNTRVHVAGQVLPNGYAIEIEDRGLGMTTEALDEANQRLLEPPAFDPSHSARLGLYVVARLGAKHRVSVQLRRSPFGGVTAVALLPTALMGTAPPANALPAGPSTRQIDGGPAAIPAQRPVSDPISPVGPVARAAPDVPVGPDGLARRRRSSATTPDQATAQALATEPARGDGTDELARRAAAESSADRTDAVASDVVASDVVASATPDVAALDFAEPGFTAGDFNAATDFADAGDLAGLSDFGRGEAADPDGPDLATRRSRRPAPAPAPPGEDGLPRRVRQANIIPQLRDQPPLVPPVPARSPDQVRSLMSALQSGTTQGRRAAHGGPGPTVAAPPARAGDAGLGIFGGASSGPQQTIPATEPPSPADRDDEPQAPTGAGGAGQIPLGQAGEPQAASALASAVTESAPAAVPTKGDSAAEDPRVDSAGDERPAAAARTGSGPGQAVTASPWAGPERSGPRRGDGGTPEVGWAEAVTAPYPLAGAPSTVGPDLAEPAGAELDHAEPDHAEPDRVAAATDGSVPTGGPATEQAAIDHTATVVHHGEVLPRAATTPGRAPASGDEDA